jgi:hypothetical protein
MAVNQTDDTAAVWQKVDEGGDNADWVRIFIDGGQALIDTNDIASDAGIVRTQLAASPSAVWMVDRAVTILDSGEEHVVFHAVAALTITEIGLVWFEATDVDAGAGTVTVGTTTGGNEIVTATQHDNSQAVGAYQALSLASGAMGAGTSMFLTHVQAASEAGMYRLQFKYDLD